MHEATPKPLEMATMQAIFEVIDELEISRESIQVPLLPAGDGAIRRLPNGRIEIVTPARRSLDDWLPELRQRLEVMAHAGKISGRPRGSVRDPVEENAHSMEDDSG